MKEAGKPVSAGEVATATGIDRKEVDKVFADLKKEVAIVSPVRCKWEPAFGENLPQWYARRSTSPSLSGTHSGLNRLCSARV